MAESNQGQSYSEIGYLTIRVSTAGGAVPLEGAAVNVRGGNIELSEVLFSLTTNSDGITPTVSLATPPRSSSEAPQDSSPAYAVYNIDVYAKGYIPAFFNNVPVFSGINSIQPAVLVPAAEAPDGQASAVTETGGGTI